MFRAVNSLQFQAKAAFPPQTVQRQTENLKMENVLKALSFIGLLVAAGALMNGSVFGEEELERHYGPKYVEDCVDVSGKPGWRYICDLHSWDECFTSQCVAFSTEQ